VHTPHLANRDLLPQVEEGQEQEDKEAQGRRTVGKEKGTADEGPAPSANRVASDVMSPLWP
jgi:hypothetical protein